MKFPLLIVLLLDLLILLLRWPLNRTNPLLPVCLHFVPSRLHILHLLILHFCLVLQLTDDFSGLLGIQFRPAGYVRLLLILLLKLFDMSLVRLVLELLDPLGLQPRPFS